MAGSDHDHVEIRHVEDRSRFLDGRHFAATARQRSPPRCDVQSERCYRRGREPSPAYPRKGCRRFFEAHCSRGDCSAVNAVCVVDVDVKKAGKRSALAYLREHHE